MLHDPQNPRQGMMRITLILATATVGSLAFGAPTGKVRPKVEEGVAWYDVSHWGVEGKGWQDTKHDYDRLPAEAEGVVRPAVWNLSRDSAGMAVRFKTDATAIWARYTLISSNLALPHMPATGVSGLDLYAEDEQGGWHWLAVARPNSTTMKVKLADGILPGRRAYTIYLPLYNGVESLEIGVAPEAAFEPIPPRLEKPIVYYGTSITQGACASRPGMAYTSILSRRLNHPLVNLGFSGNGRMDPEVGVLLGQLNAAVYVIDCLPNMEAAAIAERTEPLVRQLRQSHPQVPIVLVEDRTYTNTPFLPSRRKRHTTSRAAFKKAYERLLADGVQGLHYIQGEHLLGDDGEASTDGSHPSDLGMVRMAESLLPVLRPLLGGGG